MELVRKYVFILWGLCSIYVIVWWYNNPSEYIYALQAILVLVSAFCNLLFSKESLTRYVINIYVCMLGAFQYLYEYTHAQTSIVASENLLRNRAIRYVYFKHLIIFYLCFLLGLKISTLVPKLKWRGLHVSSCIRKTTHMDLFIAIILYSIFTFAVKYFIGVGVGQVRRDTTVPLLGVWVYLMRGMNIYFYIALIEYGLNNYKNIKQLYVLLIGAVLINFADVFLGSRSAIVFPVIEIFLVSDLLSKKGIKINIWQIMPIVILFFVTAALASFQRNGDTIGFVQFAIKRFTGYKDGIASTSMYINGQLKASWGSFFENMFFGKGYAIGTMYTEKLGFDIRFMGEAQPGFCVMAFVGGTIAICAFGIFVGIMMQKLEMVIRNVNSAVESRFIASMLFFNLYMMVIQEGAIQGYLKTNVTPVVIYWCMKKMVKITFRGAKRRRNRWTYS